uniref:F-box domain-containing protein n=1 Tax=Oryza barthii TaxID=65489 RepID=A0A0D3GRB0_9ORYZ
MAPWSDLPSDLLGLVIARLPFPADRARFRAVCRAWHSALRRHVAAPPQLPWIVLPEGTFVTVSDGGVHRMAFPESNTVCIGSTDGWLALHRTDNDDDDSVDGARTTKTRHTFLLHNPFTGATVPLAELRDILDDDFFEEFRVCKPRTSSPSTSPTTKMASPPSPINVERIIRQPRSPDGVIDAFRWSDDEDDDGGDAQDDDSDASTNDGDSVDDEGGVDADDHDESLNQEGDSDNDSEIEPVGDDGIDDVGHQWQYLTGEDLIWKTTKYELEGDDYAVNGSWHLLESSGRLLMVRRECLIAAFVKQGDHTRSVDVSEADMDAGTWVPVTGGGLGGQAIFLSELFNKSMPAPAYGEVEEDTMYFVDTPDVWDLKSGTRRPFTQGIGFFDLDRTWVFPPELIV